MATQLTDRFDQAMAYTRQLHEGHRRKGTEIPYLSHLLQVAGLVLEHGGTEDEAIAALLHDAAEDRGGEPVLFEIELKFGPNVAGMVRDNSDSLTEDPDSKASWRERKEAYLAAIGHKSEGSCRVSLADKIHNARSLLSDQQALGDSHWDRFNASKADSAWYYRSLVEAFATREAEYPALARLIRELKLTVEKLTS